jgi:hypothetical protein
MTEETKRTENNRKKFRDVMDKLALALGESAAALPKQKMAEKLDAFKALTAYYSSQNRAPPEEEGGAIHEWREQLGASPGGGNPAGRERDPDEAGDGPDDPDATDEGSPPANGHAA